MNSNYEWQKQYTKQRIGDAHRQAAQHRAAQAGRVKTVGRPGRLAVWMASLSRLVRQPGRDESRTQPPIRPGKATGQPK